MGVNRRGLFWRTRGILALNDTNKERFEDVMNLVVKREDPHTHQTLYGYVMIEDVRKLVTQGFVMHPKNGKERFVRIKEPVSEKEAASEKKPLIQKKKDFLGALTGGL